MEAILILLAIVSGLTVLLMCPSRAGMWRAIRLFAIDREEANLLIDRRQEQRRKAVVAVGARLEARSNG